MKQRLKSFVSFIYSAAPKLGLMITAALLSRAEAIGGAHPFGFAFFASCGGSPFAAAGMLLGLFSAKTGLTVTGRYIFSAAIFMAVYPGVRNGRLPFVKKEQPALLGSIILPSVGLFLLFISMSVGGYPLLYDCIILLAEAACVFVGAAAFSKALPLLGSLHLRRTLTGEETLCLSVLFGGIVSGLCGIELFKILDIGETLSVFTVIAYAIRFGSLHGGVAGAVMGLICAAARGRVDAAPASFAVSGIAAGYFGRYGKIPSCAAFILSNAVVTVLANGSSEALISLSCSLGGSLLLFLMPPKLFRVIEKAAPMPSAESVILRDRLRRLMGALSSTQNVFASLTAPFDETDASLRENMYNRTARRVCGKCGLKKYCWGRDGKNTLEALDSLAKALASGENDISHLSPSHCIRPEVFTREFGKMYDLYLCDRMWSERRRELQQSLACALEGFNRALSRILSYEGGGELCDEILADDILARLRRLGINASEIYVMGSHEETKVRIRLRNCGELGCCDEIVPDVLEKATGMKFVRLGVRDCDSCLCRYVVAPEYDIDASVASAVKENRRISGDFSVCCLLSRNTFAIALCDGMGSGDKAAKESRLCGRLLMSLLEAGLEPREAINTANSMIVGSGMGSYTAMDLCVVELGGSARLYKCGGAATYLRQGGETGELAAGGVPGGFGGEAGAQCYEKSMEDESTLVLISDGVALSENAENRWIKELIEHGGIASPQRLASEILNKARDFSGGVPRDDLTVIAASIRRKQA